MRWKERFDSSSDAAKQLSQAADELAWERTPSRTRGVAKGIYFRLPSGFKLWLLGKEFKDIDRPKLIAALGIKTA